MKYLTPMPVNDAPVSTLGKGFAWSMAWRKWLQMLSDFGVNATRPKTGPTGARYVVAGAAVTITYTGAGGGLLALPVAPLGAVWLDAFDGTTWTKIEAIEQTNGTFAVTLPAGADVHARGTYLAQLTD